MVTSLLQHGGHYIFVMPQKKKWSPRKSGVQATRMISISNAPVSLVFSPLYVDAKKLLSRSLAPRPP